MKWYGGIISDVGSGGKKIRIKYDDGTSEISDFPDKDIVVDSEGNGHHRVPAHAFIPPPMLPIPPRSISPIISLPNKIVSLVKQDPDNLLSNESQSAPLTTCKSPSQDNHQKRTNDYYVNVDRVQTPVNTSECFTSSNQSLSGLKSSTVSESPISVTHDRCTVTSSGISGCSDSSVCFDQAETTDATAKKESMIINSQTNLARKRSRSSSPLRPNYIPKLNTNTEDGDSDSLTQEKMSQNKKSRGTSLKIKLSSIKNKNKNSFNSVENAPKPLQSDSSDSEPEIQKPLSLKEEKKSHHLTDHSRQISGDETDAYISNGKKITSSEDMEADHEWMGDDEGQGQNFVMHSRKSNTMTSHSNESDIKIDSGCPSKLFERSRKYSDLDSETSAEANTKVKSLGMAIRNLQQSKATAFTKYVKKSASTVNNSSCSLPSDKSQRIIPGDLGTYSDIQMPQSETNESLSQSELNSQKLGLTDVYPDTDIHNMQSEGKNQKLIDTSFGFITDSPDFHPEVETKRSFARSDKKRRRKHRSRSSSPHPSKDPTSSKVLHDVNSDNSNNDKTGLSCKGSSILGTSSFHNADTIVMAMQLENQDNMMSNEASDIVEHNENDANNERETAVSTEASLTDDDASKMRMSLTTVEDVNDDGQISSNDQSKPGRRIGSKGGKRASSKDENQTDDVNKSSKKKYKQKGKRKAYRKVRRRNGDNGGDGSGDEDDDKNDENWVQCDRCHKWRLLPNSVSADSLPDRWYCELNYYDNEHNSCEAPQQSEQSSPRGFEESEVDNFKNNAVELSSKLNTKELITGMQSTSVESCDSFDSQDGSGSKSFSRKSVPRIDENGFDETENTDDGQSDASNLFASNSKSSSKRNRGRKEDDREKKSTRGKKKKEAENQEWVQCEKCHKWRKLPLSIQAKNLPDVWYCTMNTWDPRSASCAVAEEEIDNNENERQFTILGSGKGPFSSLNGNGSKLSYRSLIFGGANGRGRNRPISERTRAAESIFSSQITDEGNESPRPPTVMYANSSAFYYKGGINSQRTNPEEKNSESILDMMSHSSLWEDLSQGAQIMQNMTLTEQSPPLVESHTDMSKDDYIRAMKAMLYYALGAKTLEDHEILFEAQCREWDDYRWSNLRALCTIDVVTKFLESLIEDGLVETCVDEDGSGFQIVRYRRAPFDLSNATNHESINESSSRCMKISKPWKKL